MNMELAYKVQMLPQNIRNSRSLCETQLLKSGWSKVVLENDLAAAMSWAASHCLVAKQEKQRRTGAFKKTILKGNDAVEAMFASVGVDTNHITPKT